jgi:hypothetical protein
MRKEQHINIILKNVHTVSTFKLIIILNFYMEHNSSLQNLFIR